MWTRIPEVTAGKDLYYREMEDRASATFLVGASGSDVFYMGLRHLGYNHGGSKRVLRFSDYFFKDDQLTAELELKGARKPLQIEPFSNVNLKDVFSELKKQAPDIQRSIDMCVALLGFVSDEDFEACKKLVKEAGSNDHEVCIEYLIAHPN